MKHKTVFRYLSFTMLTGCLIPITSCGNNNTPVTQETKVVSRIALSGNMRLSFELNEQFTYAGLIVTVYYRDNTNKQVTNYTVSTPDMSTSGNKAVTVTYKENDISVSASYIITVNPGAQQVTLTSISLSGNYRTNFTVNETFTYAGLIVTANYSNGTSKQVTNYSVSRPDMSSVGTKSVQVTYGEANASAVASYWITVASNVMLSSISLSGSYRTEFAVGETFTYSGLIVTARYSDGSSKNVTNYSVTSPDMASSGTKTVTVTYSEGNVTKTATYQINVIAEPVAPILSYITLSGSYPTTFNVGDTFSYQGLIVTAHYDDNSSRQVTGFTVSSPSLSSEGTKTVTVTYTEDIKSAATTYTITVVAKPLYNLMNEPLIGNCYYLNHIGDIYNVWQKYRGKGITVAVIDVGFYTSHEDFTFMDGSSKISPLSGYFYTNGSTTSQSIGTGYLSGDEDHGTFCAGVVGAGANGKGVVGIAPECTLMLLKTDGKPKSISKAFKYAADNGAKVVTISIGSYNRNYEGDLTDDGSDLTTVFNEPVEYCRNKGVVVVSAAGNGGESGNPTEYTYPGATPGVIGVGGLKRNSSAEVWEGSSYNYTSSYQFCDVFAPADGMYGCCSYNASKYDGWQWKGTSFASPIVAGMAALYFEKYPNATVTDFENALYRTCHKIDNSGHYGYGRVDVSRLLGEYNSSPVTIKVKTNWSSVKMYAWNSDLTLEKELTAWPGVSMTYSNGYYTYQLTPTDYDSILFSTNGGNTKTVDLTVSSFMNGNYYDLTNVALDVAYIGKYK